ncbi:MAG: CpsD/CapB family tyrosine-protein kinase [Clostridia bacterium]|nr:CpsD/CapB family tyrosine-protein kinase [Clostridia bacterium]
MKYFTKKFLKKKNESTYTPRRSLELITSENMPFGYVEAYKSLRTNLRFITAADNVKSLVVTSALGMESKSNTSINLAITLAADQKKVIVVDGDLRKPAIHRFLNYSPHGKGLSGILTGEVKVEEAIHHLEQHHIDILPVGTVPPNPTELLSHNRMRALLKALRDYYDYVIVDAPPVSVVTDAAIIGGMVDGALLVVRSGYAPVEMVQLAKKKLEDVNVKIIGVVLSRYDTKKVGRQSGYYYSYKSYGYQRKNGYGYNYGPYEAKKEPIAPSTKDSRERKA